MDHEPSRGVSDLLLIIVMLTPCKPFVTTFSQRLKHAVFNDSSVITIIIRTYLLPNPPEIVKDILTQYLSTQNMYLGNKKYLI